MTAEWFILKHFCIGIGISNKISMIISISSNSMSINQLIALHSPIEDNCFDLLGYRSKDTNCTNTQFSHHEYEAVSHLNSYKFNYPHLRPPKIVNLLLDVCYLCLKLFSRWFGWDTWKRDFKHKNEADGRHKSPYNINIRNQHPRFDQLHFIS